MSDIDEILKELEQKPSKKSKNNVILAIIFADLIFALLDAGSGLGVAYLTNVSYYGVIVFFAGIIPLILWQKFYVNAYASDEQKKAAMVGGVLAVVSVVIVAGSIAVVRFLIDGIWVEIGLAVILVIFAAAHGLIAAYYYYIDEEISETQRTTQLVGRAARKVMRYKTAEKVLQATQRAVEEKKRVAGSFSPEAVAKVLDDPNP